MRALLNLFRKEPEPRKTRLEREIEGIIAALETTDFLCVPIVEPTHGYVVMREIDNLNFKRSLLELIRVELAKLNIEIKEADPIMRKKGVEWILIRGNKIIKIEAF